ncbi:MAG: BlaI/MecI/CopY family transcriptional regulator [Planctomycetaceae bacterium]
MLVYRVRAYSSEISIPLSPEGPPFVIPKKNLRPGDVELAILRTVWRLGPATVRQVHEALGSQRGTRLTTTLKMMQLMVAKGLLVREANSRPQRYRATSTEQRVLGGLLRDLLDRAFDGSARKLVLQLLGGGKTSRAELAEIRKAIDELEGGGGER